MSGAHIRVSDLSFSWPDGTPVFAGLCAIVGASRIGMVAPNGAGKSTLLRLMAGELAPQSGQIDIGGRWAYMPQHLNAPSHASVLDLLGVGETLQSLDAVLEGTADMAQLARADGHWDLRERIAQQLDSLGLHDLPLHRKVATLSGGEAILLGLAARLLHAPDVLMLDEPTNHLDRSARQRLKDILRAFRGCLLVASHDRDLLDDMDQIAELKPAGMRLIDGGYTTYREVAESERAAAQREVQHFRKELQRETLDLQRARERAERRASNAKRKLSDAGVPRIVAGTLARRSQVSAGKAADVHGERMAYVRDALRKAAQEVAASKLPRFSLPGTRVGPTQHVLTAANIRGIGPSGPLWPPQAVALTIRGPERITLSGDNGVGKTTLLKALAGRAALDSREVRLGSARIAYLSQGLELLAPELSLLDNFERIASRLSPQTRTDILASLGFRGERMRLPAGVLSGGERSRATLTLVLHADVAPQLLLLDEPTNNLDLDAVMQLETLLRDFEGAMVVVTHDNHFVDALKPTRRLVLTAQGLADSAE